MPSFVHGKKTRILVNEHDLTEYFREASHTTAADEVETTAFGAGEYKSYVGGFLDADLTLNGMFESTTELTAGEDPPLTLDKMLDAKLGDATAPYHVVVGPGLANGGRVKLFSGTELTYEVSSTIGDVVSANATFSSQAASKSGISLHDLSAESASSAAAPAGSVDEAAGTSLGGIGHLHLTANSRNAGSIAVFIDHSTDNSVFTPLVTFSSVNFADKSAQRIEVAGTVGRYVRARWTVTGGATGSYTFFVGFARLH